MCTDIGERTGRVQLVRHGQSHANAGAATSDPAAIPLTEEGESQAEVFASSLRTPPDRIIASPYLRAQQTARPTSLRYGVPIETWPVQEFTYLSPARCVGTTADDRRDWVADYWRRADPHYSDGPGAESFADLITRVKAAVLDLERLLLAGNDAVVFGHGQFMAALRLFLRTESACDKQLFKAMRLDLERPIPNCSGYSLNYRDGRLELWP
nr:histidine phosphatase family protein [uncultured Pseudoxanthomonas sp.]